MTVFHDQTKALTDYITARLELDFDAERQAIHATGANPAEAANWRWVREGRNQRQAMKGLLKVLTERGGEATQSALSWIAAMWSERPPLVDRRGRPYTANCGGLVYLTECCQATATFSDSTLCCRDCYEEVDSILAATPDASSVDTLWRGPVTAEADAGAVQGTDGQLTTRRVAA